MRIGADCNGGLGLLRAPRDAPVDDAPVALTPPSASRGLNYDSQQVHDLEGEA
jgi:hypothetical protein